MASTKHDTKNTMLWVSVLLFFLLFFQVTGIEGNFRETCNNVMRVLRENKDSVMAVLEAFVYDPLLNWRLIDGELNSVWLLWIGC